MTDFLTEKQDCTNVTDLSQLPLCVQENKTGL